MGACQRRFSSETGGGTQLRVNGVFTVRVPNGRYGPGRYGPGRYRKHPVGVVASRRRCDRCGRHDAAHHGRHAAHHAQRATSCSMREPLTWRQEP